MSSVAKEFKTFSQLALHGENLRREEIAALKLERKTKSVEEKVAGGVCIREPINREAAMLLARAPWYSHAPGEKKFVEKRKEKTVKTAKEKVGYTVVQQTHGDESYMKQEGGGVHVNMDVLAERICARIENNVPKDLKKLAECAINARGVLDESLNDVGRQMEQFERISKDLKNHIMTSRMSIVTECSHITHALKDIRQFFLGPDFEKEQDRLKEFVDLCERLKVLKDSGFLDVVADTMIRLASFER